MKSQLPSLPPLRSLRGPICLSALLLTYSNGLALLAYRRGWNPEQTFRYINPVLLPGLLYAAKRAHETPGSSLFGQNKARSFLVGASVGAAMGAVSAYFFKNPIVSDDPLDYTPITGMSEREMLLDVLVRVPVSIALTEELAFRGLLYPLLRKKLGPARANAFTAAVFGLWHVGVTAISTKQTNLGHTNKLPGKLNEWTVPLSAAGGALVTALAGAVFGILRERTGGMLAPIVAHWTADSLMIAALWRMGRKRSDFS